MTRDGARGPRILILQGDVDGNLGDRAILHGTCRGLSTEEPGVELTVAATGSGPVRADSALRTIPRGLRGLGRLCGAASRSDLVLCGGGGLFQDDDSLAKMPYWCLRVLLVRLFCRRLVGYSLGVGPLRWASSRLAARIAFACMERVTVRDRQALEVARPLAGKPVTVVPDPALLLAPEPRDDARNWLRQQGVPLDERKLIGVSVRRWFPPRARILPHRLTSMIRRDKARLGPGSKRMARLLAGVLDEAVERHRAHVLFLPTYRVPHEGDDQLCSEVMRNMRSPDAQLLHVDEPALYKGIAANLTVLLGGRMHPTILAAGVGTPIVGLAYNPKFVGFFEMIGLEGQVLDVEEFVRGEQVGRLSEALSRAMRGRRGRTERVAELTLSITGFHREMLSSCRAGQG